MFHGDEISCKRSPQKGPQLARAAAECRTIHSVPSNRSFVKRKAAPSLLLPLLSPSLFFPSHSSHSFPRHTFLPESSQPSTQGEHSPCPPSSFSHRNPQTFLIAQILRVRRTEGSTHPDLPSRLVWLIVSIHALASGTYPPLAPWMILQNAIRTPLPPLLILFQNFLLITLNQGSITYSFVSLPSLRQQPQQPTKTFVFDSDLT